MSAHDGSHTDENFIENPTFKPNTSVTDDEIEALKTEIEVLDDGDVKAAGDRLFERYVGTAILTIKKLAQHGNTEKIQFDAAKYIVERVLGPAGAKTREKADWEKALFE